jgi:hypothetical protein
MAARHLRIACALAPWLIAFSASAATSPRHHGAHVHGITNVDLAIDGDSLDLALEGPEINFVGFEHAPANDDERKQLNNAIVDLRVPEAWLILPADAQCKRISTEVSDPDKHDADGHSDLGAHYRFTCAQPGRLRGVDLGLLARFPHTVQVVVNSATAAGQGRHVLEQGATHVDLAPDAP